MPKLKQPSQNQFSQVTAKSNMDESSVQGQAVDTTQEDLSKRDEDLSDQVFKTSRKQLNASHTWKQFCCIVSICILVVMLITFAAIAVNCILSKQSKSQTVLQNSNTTLGIDNGSQTVKLNKQIQLENKKQQVQIHNLNTKIASLQSEVKNLYVELANEKNKLKQIHNKTETPSTANHTDTKPVPPAPTNSTQKIPSNNTQSVNPKPQNSTEAQKPSNSTATQKTNNENTNNTKTQVPQKFKVRQHPRTKIPPPNDNDHYEFSVSIDTIVQQSSMKFTFPTEDREWSGIKKPQYQRAIRLMEVVHNVNIKGQFVLDHYKFYKSAEQKYNALSKILEDEKAFFDKKYQTSKYIHDQIGICVYLPSYNNAKNKLYLRNLDSVFQQDYKNYHIVYVNDASTDGTGEYVRSYMEENQIPLQKYVIINNEKNKGNCANVYMAAHEYCKEGEIMIFLDGDDVLIGRQVFSLLNAVYQKEKVALTYGQFLLVRNNMVSSGFSRDIPHSYLEKGTFRQLKGFFSSHMKTMYVDVMRAIKMSDLQYPNGTFYDYASDVAYMTPAIDMVGTRLKFLKQLNYEYRFDTGANEPHQKQVIVEYQVYDKPASQKMQSMPFADTPKTVHYP